MSQAPAVVKRRSLESLPRVHGLEVLEIQEGSYSIPFKAMDDSSFASNLGHAEFNLCQRVRYGKIRELYVVPMQQHDAKQAFLFRHHGAEEITVGTIACQPRVWRIGFCQQVKGPFAELYVPRESSRLTVESFSESFDVRFS